MDHYEIRMYIGDKEFILLRYMDIQDALQLAIALTTANKEIKTKTDIKIKIIEMYKQEIIPVNWRLI